VTALDRVLFGFLGEDIMKATLLPPAVPAFMRPTPLPYTPAATIKVCSCCGRRHGALEWARLEFVGHQDDGEGGWLILKNCLCGSTISLAAEGPHEG
jgi:hypothetical protein